MINTDVVLSWFTGKARDNAKHAIWLLETSFEQDGWLPGASRKVRAAFTKANVIIKLARKHHKALDQINHYMVDGEYVSEIAEMNKLNRGRSGQALAHCMLFSSFEGVQKTDWTEIMAAAPAELDLVIDQARRWARDFAPIVAAIAKLDMTRPKPTFTSLGVSPTVTRTLVEMGVAGTVETLRPCPMRWVEEKRTILVMNRRTGQHEEKKMIVLVGYLDPPAGTVKHLARYHSSQCEACGHGISNPANWVPLLVDDAAGVPHLFLVGRDCSRNLFGIEMKGDLELAKVG